MTTRAAAYGRRSEDRKVLRVVGKMGVYRELGGQCQLHHQEGTGGRLFPLRSLNGTDGNFEALLQLHLVPRGRVRSYPNTSIRLINH